MLSSAPASQPLQLGSLLTALSKLVLQEKYDEATAQLSEMIAKHPDNANLYLSRGFVGLFSLNVDWKLIDEDFKKAASLRDTKVWHLIRREYFLMLPDYRAAATEHKNLLGKLGSGAPTYNDTFIETLNCLMTLSIQNPSRCLELLKLRTEFSSKSEDIIILQKAKQTSLQNIATLVPKNSSKLSDLVFINLSESLGTDTLTQFIDEEKQLRDASRDKELAFFDSSDFDNEIKNLTGSKTNKAHKNKPQRRTVATKSKSSASEIKAEVLPKQAAPVMKPAMPELVIPDNNNEPFIEVKIKTRAKHQEHKQHNKGYQHTSKPTLKPATLESNVLSMMNFPPLAATVSTKPNPTSANINHKPIRLFSAKPTLAAAPTQHLDIEPEVKEPKTTLSQTKKIKHHDFFPEAPKKQEEKAPQVTVNQYNLLLNKIHTLEQSNAYLNYVNNMNTMWRANLSNAYLNYINYMNTMCETNFGMQPNTPLIPPFTMTQEAFIEWQRNQSAAQQQTHPRSNGFGNKSG